MRTDGLILGLLAAFALLGCPDGSQSGQRQSAVPGNDQATAGGGVSEGAPASEPNPALTTQYLGNAFVSAARAHNAIVQGNFRAARNEIMAIRRQLRLAEQWATLEQQRAINRLEGQVIEVEAQLGLETGNPRGESARLLRDFLSTYDALAAGEGGGAGGVEPEEGATPSGGPEVQ